MHKLVIRGLPTCPFCADRLLDAGLYLYSMADGDWWEGPCGSCGKVVKVTKCQPAPEYVCEE